MAGRDQWRGPDDAPYPSSGLTAPGGARPAGGEPVPTTTPAMPPTFGAAPAMPPAFGAASGLPPATPARPGPPPVPPPAGGPWRPPKRVEPVAGTPFAVAYLDVPRAISGPSVGALVAGIGSLLVTVLVGCFGLLGAQADVGALVGGAFGLLATAMGAAGLGLGLVGLRQVRRAGVGGRGMAISGIACGAAGIGLTMLVIVALLVAQ